MSFDDEPGLVPGFCFGWGCLWFVGGFVCGFPIVLKISAKKPETQNHKAVHFSCFLNLDCLFLKKSSHIYQINVIWND